MNEPGPLWTRITPTWTHLFWSSSLRRRVRCSRILNLSPTVARARWSFALFCADHGLPEECLWQLPPQDLGDNEKSVFPAWRCWKPRFPEETDGPVHTWVHVCGRVRVSASSCRTQISWNSQNSGASPWQQLMGVLQLALPETIPS